MIEIGKDEAKLLYQSDLAAEDGYFVPLTIFGEVPSDARIAKAELFGPVLCVMKAKDIDSAIAIANGSEYALVDRRSLFTQPSQH